MLLHVAQTGQHLLRTQNVSDQNQKHFLCPGHKICVPNKCCAHRQTGKHLCRQQCVHNNVSSFASTFRFQCRICRINSFSPCRFCFQVCCLLIKCCCLVWQTNGIQCVRTTACTSTVFSIFHLALIVCCKYRFLPSLLLQNTQFNTSQEWFSIKSNHVIYFGFGFGFTMPV